MMRAPLTEDELDARLLSLGMVRDDATGAPPPSKNRTVICRDGKKRLFVKVADGPGNVGVLREGSVLERVGPLSAMPNSLISLPTVHKFDPATGLLALEWIGSGETLHHFHRRTMSYPSELALQVGNALGYLHRMSREQRSHFALADSFRDESDLLDCFLRMRPDFYARLSEVGIDFFAQVQADATAMKGLQRVAERQSREADAALLHGDLRQANLLRVEKPKSQVAVYYLDWELSFWGDPARDLGSLLADYVLGWLAPEHRSEIIPKVMLEDYARGLLRGYRIGRERSFELDTTFQERIVEWVGVSLLIAVYGLSHYEQTLDARALGVARHGLDMLGAPDGWPRILWGDSFD